MPVIKNPTTVIKSGGGEDKLAYRISNLGNYSYENNEITSLKNSAFANDANLTEIKCDNVITINTNAFNYCTSLVSASFLSATTIANYAFSYCSSLASINFPLVTSINTNAFINCTSLTSASFPLVTDIPSTAFSQCSSLASINFPLATSIGNSAFGNCSSLTTVLFPSATSIGSQTFARCSRLISASFPLATSIGWGAFNYCSALTSITLGNATQVCSLSSADSIPATSSHHVNIYVPISLIASYRTATNWSTLYNNGYISFLPIDGQLINTSITNGTFSGPVAIANNGTATITITANSGYELPTSVSVTGASYTYSNGVITLSNPTAEVNISATCPQATPSGYSVSVSQINESPWGEGHAYYSTDNGATWIEITTSGLLVSNATQIKFRVHTDNYAMEAVELTCQSLNVHIEDYSAEAQDSANITLTFDVSDVVVYFNDQD